MTSAGVDFTGHPDGPPARSTPGSRTERRGKIANVTRARRRGRPDEDGPDLGPLLPRQLGGAFYEESTGDAPFHVSRSESVTVPMMHQHSYREDLRLRRPRLVPGRVAALRQRRVRDGRVLAEEHRRARRPGGRAHTRSAGRHLAQTEETRGDPDQPASLPPANVAGPESGARDAGHLPCLRSLAGRLLGHQRQVERPLRLAPQRTTPISTSTRRGSRPRPPRNTSASTPSARTSRRSSSSTIRSST